MLEQAIEPKETHDARERFQTELARMRDRVLKAKAGLVEDISDVAPHLLSQRR